MALLHVLGTIACTTILHQIHIVQVHCIIVYTFFIFHKIMYKCQNQSLNIGGGANIFPPSCLSHPASPCLHLYEEVTLYSKQRVCSGHGMRNYCQNNNSKKHLVSGVLAGHLAETATDGTFSPFQKQNGFVTSILYYLTSQQLEQKSHHLRNQNLSRCFCKGIIFCP